MEMNARDYIDIGLGELLGLATSIALVAVVLYRRFRTLSSIDFKLNPPDIPRIILLSIKTAEAEFYGSQPYWRRAVKALQDMLTFLWPGLVYKMNSSVGRYRIKPHTIDDLIPWAIKSGFLTMHSEHDDQSKTFIAYFSHQPAINDWQISVYLEKLRCDHPTLRHMEWREIGTNDEAIAKLYSGYMGAGGEWDEWRRTAAPGAESKRRFQCDERSGEYRLIQRLREQPTGSHAEGSLTEGAE